CYSFVAGRKSDRSDLDPTHGRQAAHSERDGAPKDFCGSSSDRDRERAAVRRGAGAHARAERIAGAADRDLGGAGRDLEFARRGGACVRGHVGERGAHLRGQLGNLYLRDGDVFRLAAAHNTPPALVDERKNVPLRVPSPSGTLALDKMVRTKKVVQI